VKLTSAPVTMTGFKPIMSSTTMENSQIKLHFSEKGTLIKVNMDNSEIHLSQEFAFYEGAVGNNSRFIDRASGAYIFRPLNQTPEPLGEPLKSSIIRGPLVQEVHQKFNDWTSQVIRLYKDEKIVEFEWMIGPLPKKAKGTPGLEVITRYSSDIQSGDRFSTDSNGRFMIDRTRNFRPTWKLNLTEPVSSNYYPVTSRLSLMEESNEVTPSNRRQMWVLTDRAQGGTSLRSGQLELMLHRRLFNDDAFGVGEALNETAFGVGLVARGKHRVLLCDETLETCQHESRLEAEKMLMKPILMFGPDCHHSIFKTSLKPKFSPLPDNVKLLTLERWTNNSVLIRLENMSLQKTSVVSIVKILESIGKFSGIVETSLDGNVNIENMKRLHWPTMRNNGKKSSTVDPAEITLNPKEIRSFVISLQ